MLLQGLTWPAYCLEGTHWTSTHEGNTYLFNLGITTISGMSVFLQKVLALKGFSWCWERGAMVPLATRPRHASAYFCWYFKLFVHATFASLQWIRCCFSNMLVIYNTNSMFFLQSCSQALETHIGSEMAMEHPNIKATAPSPGWAYWEFPGMVQTSC